MAPPTPSNIHSPPHLSNDLQTMSDSQPHFVLVPLMAQGHMIPMVDMARLLATRGATVSYITTPVNAARIKPVIDSVTSSRLPIHFVSLPFPFSEVGLPEGSENVDLLTPENFKPFVVATSFLHDPLLLHLQDPQNLRPTCIISDYCHPWTMHVAQVLNIPRFIFHGPCCLYMLGFHNITQHKLYDNITDINQPFMIPDLLPYQLKVTRAQVPGFFGSPGWEDIRDAAAEAEATCDGVLLNSFDELEPLIIEKYRGTIQKPVWAVGPLSLYNNDFSDKANRGNKPSVDEHKVLAWLDMLRAKSVIYVNFGSLVRTRLAQLMELGSGLEASGYPFIWVLNRVQLTSEVTKWLEEFEARNCDRSLVIKGWAPQLVILSHPAVGGFVTHCGWNSMLEAISVGMPMITWPHNSDQFLNEKLVVEILRVGTSLGVTTPSYLDAESEEVMVTRADVEEAVIKLMDGEREGKERRERARELGEKARKAIEEGGSSHENLSGFIRYVSQLGRQQTKREFTN